MERRSDKHGPRTDEELKAETRSMEQGAPVSSRAEEFRETEGEPPEPPPASGEAGEARHRSEVARHLRPSTFPATREQLVEDARDSGASDEVLEELGRLPSDTRFETVEAVWEALGEGP